MAQKVRDAFDASQFTATKWDSADDKAVWLEKLARFVEAGFPVSKFTKSLYNRLSNMFGHIAHYDRDGFYATWFSSPARQQAWRAHVLSASCAGDPAWTWSDAEAVFKSWLTESS